MAEQMGNLFPEEPATTRPTMGHVPAISGGFDYSLLPSEVVDEARAVARRIVENQARHLAMAVDAGRELAAIKDKVGHGNWLPWLEQACGINARTAQNYMATAEAFGTKYETVAHLPASTVYRLAAPKVEAVREAVVSELEAGTKLTAKEIETRIWEAQQTAKHSRRETPQDRKARLARERAATIRHAKKSYAEHEARTNQAADRRALAERLAGSLLAGMTDAELSELRASFEPLGGRVTGAEYLGAAILEALHPWLREERQQHERRSDSIARERLERAQAA